MSVLSPSLLASWVKYLPGSSFEELRWHYNYGSVSSIMHCHVNISLTCTIESYIMNSRSLELECVIYLYVICILSQSAYHCQQGHNTVKLDGDLKCVNVF